MRRWALPLFLSILAACSKNTSAPSGAGVPEKPAPETAVAPSAPFSCETLAIAKKWEELRERERARPQLVGLTKTTPSAANFRALRDFETAYADLGDIAATQLSACPDVPATELAALRKNVETARASALHLTESLPPADGQ